MRSSRRSDYYEKWQPTNSRTPYSGSYGSPLHYKNPNTVETSQTEQPPTVPRYGAYRESPRSVRKFDFTYPQTSIVGSYHDQGASNLTPRGYSRPRADPVLPHYQYQYHRGRSPPRDPESTEITTQRSPSQERPGTSHQQRSYFHSWRSTLSSLTPSSLRRLRTASSDRSTTGNAFDTSRRFQPSYRSWNEKDNFYPSTMKR